MKFEEAISEMRKGKKIRCLKWPKNYFIYIKQDDILDNYNSKSPLLRANSFFEEWEIYEEDIEQKNISDSIDVLEQIIAINNLIVESSNKLILLLRNLQAEKES